MSDCIGPNSYLPGRELTPPIGQYCDTHTGVFAVKRIVGETDSMGSELLDMCQLCYDNYVASLSSVDTSGHCDVCGKHHDHLRKFRDPEEGQYGPVYNGCDNCITTIKTSFL